MAMGLSIFHIKLIHSAIFLVLSACVLYLAYSAIFDAITLWTWVALVLVFVEGLILFLNGWRCPLTTHAEHRGALSGSVADIFLPRWFADRLFLICGVASAAAAGLILLRWLGQ